MKTLFPILGALTLSAAAFADGAPVVAPDSVQATVNETGDGIYVTYRLTGAQGVVTFDVLTNAHDDAWVSIGADNLGYAVGDVYSLQQPNASGDADKKFFWSARKGWPGHALGKFKVQVTAWSVNTPPDYMVVDLKHHNPSASKGTLYYLPNEYYPAAGAVPQGVTHRMYKTEKLVLRKVPAAGVVFKMGSPKDEAGRLKNYEGQRAVTFEKDFYLCIYTITLAQLKYAIQDDTLTTACLVDQEDPDILPFTGASWADWHGISKQDYTGTMNRTPSAAGYHYSMFVHQNRNVNFYFPTAAELEYATRAGVAGPQSRPDLPYGDCEWYGLNSKNAAGTCVIHGVGLKQPNRWGFYDMQGNCLEWLHDFADGKYSDDMAAKLTEPLVDPIYGIESDTALSNRSCAYGNYNSDDIYRIAYISYGQLTYNRQHQSCGARVRIDAIAFR